MMNLFKRSAHVLLICLISVNISGCGTTQSMVSENSPYHKKQLAKLLGANATAPKYPFIAVDGKKIDFSFMNGFSNVYLEPGLHTLVYYTKGYRSRTITYRIHAKENDLGIEANLKNSDTKFEINDLGIIPTYGYHYPITCKIMFESGKTYGRTEITKAISNAGCHAPYYAQKINRTSDITTIRIYKENQLVYTHKCEIRLDYTQAGNDEAIRSAYEQAGCGGLDELTIHERLKTTDL